MRIGPYEIEEGALYLIGFLVVAAILLIHTWFANYRLNNEWKAIAKQNGWTWYGTAPPELRAELEKLQDSSYGWRATKVMGAPGAGGEIFMFFYQRHRSSDWIIDGIGCLVAGNAGPNAPIVTFERKPLAAVDSLSKLSSERIEKLGGATFRERIIVNNLGWAYHGNQGGYFGNDPKAVMDIIELPQAFEQELLQWHRPLGETQAWSTVRRREDVILVTNKKSLYRVVADDWRVLAEMTDRLGRTRDSK